MNFKQLKRKITATAAAVAITMSISGVAQSAPPDSAPGAAKFKAARDAYLKDASELRRAADQVRAVKTEANAKAFLDKTVAVLIKRIETMKTWVSNRDALDEAEKANIIAELDTDITWLQDKATAVADSTPQEIRATAREIRNYWKKHRIIVKRVAGQVLSARVDRLIEKSEASAARMRTLIDELKEDGTDTAELEAALSDYETEVAQAKEEYALAKTKFQEISSWDDAKTMWREGHALVKSAHASLRKAHTILVGIIKDIKTD